MVNIIPYKDNVEGNIVHLRDTYLTAKKECVSELLKNEDMRDLISEINAETPDKLFDMTQNIVDKVEMRLISDEEMEKTE